MVMHLLTKQVSVLWLFTGSVTVDIPDRRQSVQACAIPISYIKFFKTCFRQFMSESGVGVNQFF